ncbi:glycosyltransferase family 4 protein [Aeoliella mucimassa]|uniref:D-inositol 3-phosphate glycosyltransferase n=1 Tax=Aeoliella mucimassa TaxID=2527972 RepID=A0A518AQ99_9BACT|nr:glycosyltransferase family 4 protein [Aeoliella mucimassa]QDU56894.1 D-inositol 3-phosphate glycosyltransferase [Aeoliella mucimassa]
MATRRVLNVADCKPEWRWIEDRLAPLMQEYEWQHVYASPLNRLERSIKRLPIARLRGTLTAAFLSRKSDCLTISHGPSYTYACEFFRRLLRSQSKHLAFAFNFTRLPQGKRLQKARSAFKRVDKLVVFSNYERRLYAEHFQLDPAQLEFVHWGVGAPRLTGSPPSYLPSGPYICAVGSQGRDYSVLCEAAKLNPELKMVIVAHSENVSGLEFPENVILRTHIPLAEVMHIVAQSTIMAIPLLSEQTCCGHVTAVTGMYFGKPILATSSVGIVDYVHDGTTGKLVSSNDPELWAHELQCYLNDPELCATQGQAAKEFAYQNCTEEALARRIADIVTRLDSPGEKHAPHFSLQQSKRTVAKSAS